MLRESSNEKAEVVYRFFSGNADFCSSFGRAFNDVLDYRKISNKKITDILNLMN
jgi:hypothetical protein